MYTQVGFDFVADLFGPPAPNSGGVLIRRWDLAPPELGAGRVVSYKEMKYFIE